MMRHIVSALVLLLLVSLFCIPCTAEQNNGPVIGIAWIPETQIKKYAQIETVIKEAGGIPMRIPQIVTNALVYDEELNIVDEALEESGMLKLEYANQVKECDFSLTEIENIMKDVDGVIFMGGEDIRPTLFRISEEEKNFGETINATRDVSDYLLMAYCLENDIPMLAICRGKQMLAIVSGGSLIQDIPHYYAEMGKVDQNAHRIPAGIKGRSYARHDIDIIDQNSLIYDIVGEETLENVSSWHHQSVIGIENTLLKVTATATVDGIDIIECIEREDLSFCMGIQFHPENDCVKVLVDNQPEKVLCDYEHCIAFFEALVRAACARESNI